MVDSVLPCGIPCVMVCCCDFAYCVCVVCCRFVKYEEIKEIVLSSKLKLFFSLLRSFACDIVSYALDKSRYIATVGCLFLICLWSLSRIACNAMEVVELGRNAYCVLEMRLCVMQCAMIWSLMMVSNIFPIIGRSDMGL